MHEVPDQDDAALYVRPRTVTRILRQPLGSAHSCRAVLALRAVDTFAVGPQASLRLLRLPRFGRQPLGSPAALLAGGAAAAHKPQLDGELVLPRDLDAYGDERALLAL